MDLCAPEGGVLIVSVGEEDEEQVGGASPMNANAVTPLKGRETSNHAAAVAAVMIFRETFYPARRLHVDVNVKCLFSRSSSLNRDRSKGAGTTSVWANI